MRKSTTTRSPLRDRPLRLPGQSVQDQLEKLIDERILIPALSTLVFVCLAALQWFYYFVPARGTPWPATVIALIAIAYTTASVALALPRRRALKLGRDGERIVAEQLDKLKVQGAAVIHDVVADRFNVDHVIVSTQGVFVAETKTRSKRSPGSPTVTYDGQTLRVDGFPADPNPLAQARMNAEWIAEQLRQSTGKHFPTKPVVLFPGWFVERVPRGSDVWILEPKALPAFIANEPTRISESDLHLAVYHLTRMVRPRTGAD
jgi:hypothetical protein